MTDKMLTEGAAMTALCLFDAACDYEHSAGYARGVREAGGTVKPGQSRAAEIGERLMDRRSEYGSYQFRQDILELAPLVDEAWDRLGEDLTDSVGFSFDFEFCPVAIELWLETAGGLSDHQYVDRLVERGRAAIASQQENMARQLAERERETREEAARQLLEQALALLQGTPAK